MRQLHLARIFILFYICILARGVWAFFILSECFYPVLPGIDLAYQNPALP